MKHSYHSIPITKILSASCRDFFCFRELEIFDFEDGLNIIVGNNGSGKSTAVRMIVAALSPNTSHDWDFTTRNDSTKGSLIEIRFVVEGKICFLRRVIVHGTTTDLHLYIETGTEMTFLRDNEVVRFLAKLKPINVIKTNNFDKRKFRITFSTEPPSKDKTSTEFYKLIKKIISQKKNTLDKNHVLLIEEIESSMDSFYNEHVIGSSLRYKDLPGGYSRLWKIIGDLGRSNTDLVASDSSKVYIIDQAEQYLSRKEFQILLDILYLLSKEYDLQFIITSSRKLASSLTKHNYIDISRIEAPKQYSTNLSHSLKRLNKLFTYRITKYRSW
jgi:predicted ATP-dependent endonuclease of OLD family